MIKKRYKCNCYVLLLSQTRLHCPEVKKKDKEAMKLLKEKRPSLPSEKLITTALTANLCGPAANLSLGFSQALLQTHHTVVEKYCQTEILAVGTFKKQLTSNRLGIECLYVLFVKNQLTLVLVLKCEKSKNVQF